MEEAGLNIATRAGEGEAKIYRWDEVHRTLNQIAQRDFLHGRQLKDEYAKSQLQIQQSQKGLRPADIPLFKAAYDKYKNASLMLQQKAISRDPEKMANYSKIQNDGLTEAMSLAERSKEASKLKGSYYDQWMKDGGLNASEDYNDKMQLFDKLNVDEIRQHNFDNPMNFFNPKDDTPKDLQKRILGDQQVDQRRTPLFDDKGKRMGDEVEEFYAYKTPLDVVAKNAGRELAQSRSETKRTQKEYANGNPNDIAAIMDNANKQIAKLGGAPLPNDYAGYYAAQAINQAATVKSAGSKKREYDQLYMQNLTREQQLALHASSEKNANARFYTGQANQQRRFNTMQSQKNSNGYPAMDTTPIYNALKEGNRELATKALNALAANNPGKPISITISRLDILDAGKRRALLDKFGITDKDVEIQVGANESEQSKRDRKVAKVLEVINQRSGGSKIKVSDLDRHKIVGAFIHMGKVNEYDPSTKEYKGTKQTRLPVIFNPHTSTVDQFNSEISNEYSPKKKPYLEEQAEDLESAYSIPNTSPAQPEQNKWSQYKRN
ncbi:MAG: hypothetical protein WKF91_10280 [Segetibacter sp.]